MNKISNDIELAADFLRQGELVGIPTETVYGLAANALDSKSVIKIFEAKKRPSFDPLIVHISGLEELDKYALIPFALCKTLAQKFWPGPLTLVLPKKSIIPDEVTSGLDTVGIRVPAHAITLELLKKLEFPLAAPSANPFGYISPTRPDHVQDQLGNELALILDGGDSEYGVESTIIEVLSETSVRVLRWGGLDEQLLKSLKIEVTSNTMSSSNPIAPGMLLSHYAPRKPFYTGVLTELLQIHAGKKIGVIQYLPNVIEDKASIQYHALTTNGDLKEASHHLFALMRQLDQSDIDVIIAEFVPDRGLGKAINDRLRRASFPSLKGPNDEA